MALAKYKLLSPLDQAEPPWSLFWSPFSHNTDCFTCLWLSVVHSCKADFEVVELPSNLLTCCAGVIGTHVASCRNVCVFFLSPSPLSLPLLPSLIPSHFLLPFILLPLPLPLPLLPFPSLVLPLSLLPGSENKPLCLLSFPVLSTIGLAPFLRATSSLLHQFHPHC